MQIKPEPDYILSFFHLPIQFSFLFVGRSWYKKINKHFMEGREFVFQVFLVSPLCTLGKSFVRSDAKNNNININRSKNMRGKNGSGDKNVERTHCVLTAYTSVYVSVCL